MMTKEDMRELFANIEQNAPWDRSKPLLWGYFFADASKAKLEAAVPLLAAQGYRLVTVLKSEPDAEEPDLWWLHVEKVEHHTVDTLHARNEELYRFAEAQQIDAYDGMDVGPAH
ncbi:MAG: ribonuclease E inhibitor RraB [Pseudomonadota bacterium]